MTNSFSAAGRDAQQDPGSEELELLKRGRLEVAQYLESRLEVALQNLGSAVTEEQRDEIRNLLRDHFLEDPALRIYAERAQKAEKAK